jgi:hypothetical protein
LNPLAEKLSGEDLSSAWRPNHGAELPISEHSLLPIVPRALFEGDDLSRARANHPLEMGSGEGWDLEEKEER